MTISWREDFLNLRVPFGVKTVLCGVSSWILDNEARGDERVVMTEDEDDEATEGL